MIGRAKDLKVCWCTCSDSLESFFFHHPEALILEIHPESKGYTVIYKEDDHE